MRGYGLVDLNELAARIHREHTKHINKKRAVIAAAIIAPALLVGWQHSRIAMLKGAVVQLVSKNEALTKELTSTKNELNGIKQAMTVSLDARRLGRPVRLHGEMIVVFAGEVKDK